MPEDETPDWSWTPDAEMPTDAEIAKQERDLRWPPGRPVPLPLSEQERRALVWAANGLDWRGIAEQMGLSPETVKDHLANARHKLAAKNTVHAVAVALRAGLID